MKSILKSFGSFLVFIIIVQLSLSFNLKHKQSEYEDIWKNLFNGSRGQSCKGATIRRNVIAASKAEARAIVTGIKAKKGKFAWIKEWGYGQAAYVYDFLDPVILTDALKSFHLIYDDIIKISSEDRPDYKDPFDLKKLVAGDTGMQGKALADLKLINKNYDPDIYSISVNAVQLHEAMKNWSWAVDFGLQDYAVTFIKSYDINGDGRLNARELILGAIDHNKHLFGSVGCTHCFEDLVKKIDAIFLYIDCDSDGVINAEDIWHNLPKMKRSSAQFNIFALGNDAGIRTASVNDFILMNMSARNGVMNKIEFRNALLFGLWNRQTDEKKILDDDSRTLKSLRWKDDMTVDIKAADYIRDQIVDQMKKKLN